MRGLHEDSPRHFFGGRESVEALRWIRLWGRAYCSARLILEVVESGFAADDARNQQPM